MTTSLVVRNIGLHGALVHARLALPPGSMQVVTADVNGQVEQLSVRVTRCNPAPDREIGFAIGIEFLSLSARMRLLVERWVASGGLEPTA